ncbi:hypothetical protein B0H14DRAFT_2576239 [Mycena olivaceomarginata]|nr:hypothetical protein B0H14DRAFT_2576239 [Mycena olivaceomarginata]
MSLDSALLVVAALPSSPTAGSSDSSGSASEASVSPDRVIPPLALTEVANVRSLRAEELCGVKGHGSRILKGKGEFEHLLWSRIELVELSFAGEFADISEYIKHRRGGWSLWERRHALR